MAEISRKNLLHSAEMALTFLRNYDGDIGKLSGPGLEALHEYYGEVEEEDRAEVFVQFLEFLNDSGVKYSTSDFEA